MRLSNNSTDSESGNANRRRWNSDMNSPSRHSGSVQAHLHSRFQNWTRPENEPEPDQHNMTVDALLTQQPQYKSCNCSSAHRRNAEEKLQVQEGKTGTRQKSRRRSAADNLNGTKANCESILTVGFRAQWILAPFSSRLMRANSKEND